MIESPERLVVEAVRNATKRANPALEKLLEVHLQTTANAGFELAFKDPQKFKDSINKLFGEYSGRLLEMLIVDEIKKLLELDENIDTLEQAVGIIKKLLV
jgi:hypothetical protein